MKKLALVLAVMMVLSGCAGLTLTGAGYDLSTIAPAKDSQVAVTTAEVKDAWGQNSRVTNTWQVQGRGWVLVSSQQASGAGIGQTATTAFVGGVPTAVALPIAANLIKPARTNVSQTNQGGQGGNAVTGPVSNSQGQSTGIKNVNAQAQGQGQGQAQGQAQGQLQGQNQNQGQLQQDHPVLSPGTVF